MLERLNHDNTVWQTQIIVGELDFLDALIDLETFCEHAKSSVRHAIVAHVKNLEVTFRDQTLLEGLNLRICKFIANQVELADWQYNEQI